MPGSASAGMVMAVEKVPSAPASADPSRCTPWAVSHCICTAVDRAQFPPRTTTCAPAGARLSRVSRKGEATALTQAHATLPAPAATARTVKIPAAVFLNAVRDIAASRGLRLVTHLAMAKAVRPYVDRY